MSAQIITTIEETKTVPVKNKFQKIELTVKRFNIRFGRVLFDAVLKDTDTPITVLLIDPDTIDYSVIQDDSDLLMGLQHENFIYGTLSDKVRKKGPHGRIFKLNIKQAFHVKSLDTFTMINGEKTIYQLLRLVCTIDHVPTQYNKHD